MNATRLQQENEICPYYGNKKHITTYYNTSSLSLGDSLGLITLIGYVVYYSKLYWYFAKVNWIILNDIKKKSNVIHSCSLW